MKESFIEHSTIGNLRIRDVLVHYDYPRIFVCEDIFNMKYLFSEIDSNYDADQWIVIKLSTGRYYELISNQMGMRDVYLNPEEETYYKVVKNYTNNIVDVATSHIIEEEILPTENFTIGFQEQESQDYEDLKDMVNKTGSPILDLSLFPNNPNITDIESDLFTGIVVKLKKLLNGFADKTKYKLRISTQRGSFIIRFNLNSVTNIFSENESINTINKVNTLFTSNNKLEINELLDGNKTKIDNYKSFVKLLHTAETDLKISTYTPISTEVTSKYISKEVLTETFNNLEKLYFEEVAEIKCVGILLALNIPTKKFTLKILETNEEIKGNIVENINEVYHIPKKYEADLDVTYKIIEGKEKNIIKKEYLLKDLYILE